MLRLAIAAIVLSALPARAQDASGASPHALCQTHADAMLTALGEAKYDAAAANFDDSLRTRYTPAKLKQDYEALPAKLGKAMGRGRAHAGEMGGHPAVMTALIFEHGLSTAEIRCDGAGAVSDFKLETTQTMGTP